MEMTLDEAIKHLNESLADQSHDWGCEECKVEHEQLAEWLRELRELRLTNGAIKLGNMKEALYEIKELKEELEGWQNNPFEIITDICKQCTDCRDCCWDECCPFSRYREDYGKYPCFPDAWEDENG